MRSIHEKAIVGIAGLTLSAEEKALFSTHPPYGFILFTRNCASFDQLKDLVDTLKQYCTGKHILIDQEGGRVARLKAPMFKTFPAPSTAKTPQESYDHAALICQELQKLGITTNCAPLADLVFKETHEVIGDRSYGSDPDHVAQLAKASIAAHIDHGITPIIKHIPGHGRATADSHIECPIVTTDKDTLIQSDFKAFQLAIQGIPPEMLWAMTAHVMYRDIDPVYVATQSSTVIQHYIRDAIGFHGKLITDCLTMKALEGDLYEKSRRCLTAGCDLLLHCSGNLDDIQDWFLKE